jgi:hypothetical protein
LWVENATFELRNGVFPFETDFWNSIFDWKLPQPKQVGSEL